jgi:hypothetical protein
MEGTMGARKLVLVSLVQAGAAAACLAEGILQNGYNVVAKIDANPAQLEQTSMNMTFNGKSYFSGSGGSTFGNRIGEFDMSGGYIASHQPNLDLRSIFTRGGSGDVLFARQFADNTIYKETGPGTFAPSFVLDGSMDYQSAVAFNDNGEYLVAMQAGGLVQVWDTNGVEQPSFQLIKFGDMAGEDTYPQNVCINTGGNYFITYSNGILSAWTPQGNRVGYAKLADAGTSFDSHFSLSYANGLVWVITEANGVWLGYDIPELVVGGCYPDCDGSGALDIDDFICFQTFFAIGDPYADCDGSGALDIDDFICFQTFFAIGC